MVSASSNSTFSEGSSEGPRLASLRPSFDCCVSEGEPLSSSAMEKWAALFDWDGVVIDSSVQHEKSWERLAEEENLALPEGHFKKGFGMKNVVIIPELLNWTQDETEIHRLSDRKEELYREIVQEDGISALPGVKEWLSVLKGAGVPCVVGSSTARKNIETCVEVIGLEGFFAEITSAEDVKRGKPAPDVFLKAMGKASKLSGVEFCPERSVVFEDAQVGVDAGLAAGMKVIGVATTHPDGHLQGVHEEVRFLNELTLDRVEEILGA